MRCQRRCPQNLDAIERDRERTRHGDEDQAAADGREEAALLPRRGGRPAGSRDGRFIENIGKYHPLERPITDRDRRGARAALAPRRRAAVQPGAQPDGQASASGIGSWKSVPPPPTWCGSGPRSPAPGACRRRPPPRRPLRPRRRRLPSKSRPVEAAVEARGSVDAARHPSPHRRKLPPPRKLLPPRTLARGGYAVEDAVEAAPEEETTEA